MPVALPPAGSSVAAPIALPPAGSSVVAPVALPPTGSSVAAPVALRSAGSSVVAPVPRILYDMYQTETDFFVDVFMAGVNKHDWELDVDEEMAQITIHLLKVPSLEYRLPETADLVYAQTQPWAPLTIDMPSQVDVNMVSVCGSEGRYLIQLGRRANVRKRIRLV
ncbi:hypothetical protein HDU85_007589 [Gaertneriomyces sp. JEL0708]|nr:hypothetical protein HDU85_007589 [Gaertneriomyces sp. JEL0708]